MKRMTRIGALALALALAAGCDSELALRTSSKPPSDEDITVYGPENDALKSSAVDRYDDLSDGGTLDDAVTTHQKYIDLLEKHNNLIEAHAKLTQTHRDQKEQITALGKENTQLKKELKDASSMLVTMRRELDKWKADIFAYRAELKRSLDTNRMLMERIVRILGGELPATEPAKTASAGGPE